MNLLEKDIEDIIYTSPWLLDERYVIPKIRGSRNEFGRQINIGKNNINRYIDLLFKDTRDNRPVIVELKKGSLTRENIAQILEYRALVISMDEENKIKWQSEFGQNYYCPKLILIGTIASEEVKISANLAGIEIRTLTGIKDLEVNFENIKDINNKLTNWNRFLNTGNRTFEDREQWIEQIYTWIKDTIDEYKNKEITSINKLYKTSSKDAWLLGRILPFINIPFKYKGDYLGGIYEYDDESKFSNKDFYFDFLVQRIYFVDNESNELLEKIINKASELLKNKGYVILNYDKGEGIVTVKISRVILTDYNSFKKVLIQLIDDSIYMNDEIIKVFGDFKE